MKVLVFSDLHGSLNCLKAIINSEDFKTADKVIFLGDVVFGASRPNECIELLDIHNISCIVGNNDAYCFDKIPKADICTFSKGKLTQLEWMKNTTTQNNKDIMRNWPKSLTMSIAGKTFYFTHYMWEYLDDEYSVVDTDIVPTLENRQQLFSSIDADYYIYGHEHRYHYFKDDKKHYMCLASAGLQSPSKFIVIESDGDKIDIIEKSVAFDINEEITLMDNAGYPYNKSKIG